MLRGSRTFKIVLLIAGLAATCPVLAACGGATSTPTSAIKTYLSALADGNGATACAQLTGKVKRSVAPALAEDLPGQRLTTCEDAIKAISKQAGADDKRRLKSVKVADVKITGKTATARVLGGQQPEQGEIHLVRSGERWLIASLS